MHANVHLMTIFQAIVMGLLQGITELFPISSLGHSVILPQLLGWTQIIKAQGATKSFFLTFLVGLHVATAAALFVYYRHEWVRIIKGVVETFYTRKIETPYQRLGWLLIVATIPAGIMGLLFEHLFRTIFAKPLWASFFLFVNGVVLVIGERKRKEAESAPRRIHSRGTVRFHKNGHRKLDTLEFKEAGVVGVAQVFALLAGISRSGITMVAGLVRGMDHEDSARFSFLLATPIILAAGLYKLPSLFGHDASGVRPQILIGSVAAFVAAYISVAFLVRYFRTKNLYPFAIYSLIIGAVLFVHFL